MKGDGRRERVARMFAQGATAQQMASTCGVSERTIQRDLLDLGLRPKARPWTVEEIVEARRMLDEGMPYPEVARTIRGGSCSSSWLRIRLPGYEMTRQEVAQYALLGRRFARISSRRRAA